MRLIKDKKSLSQIGIRYEKVSFENTMLDLNYSFNKAYERCKKYCEVQEEAIKKGQGMYIFGNVGVGKTHLLSCIANNLTEQKVQVLFTNFFEISNAIKFTQEKRKVKEEIELIEKIINMPILLLDDLGMGLGQGNDSGEENQNLLFNLLNKRYNNNKATIFASNYKIEELNEKCGIYEQTIDRIYEMSSGVKLEIPGESVRKNLKVKIEY